MADALQQQRLARLAQHMGTIIRRRAVDPEADGDAGIPHAPDRGDPRSEAHVGAGAMGDARLGPGEQRDAGLVELDAMGVPDVRPDPAEVLRIGGGRAAEPRQAEGDIAVVLGEMGVQEDAMARWPAPPHRA